MRDILQNMVYDIYKWRFIVFCFFAHTLFAEMPHHESVKLISRPAGLFSVFLDVLSTLQFYEKGRFNGIAVDFGETGKYYTPSKGPNWWTYYFEPISLGKMGNHPVIGKYMDHWRVEFCNNREYNHYLIDKYIHLKPHMLEEIDLFEKLHFQGSFIIGVHYRGTDKTAKGTAEAPYVSYEEVAFAILDFIKEKQLDQYKIFVASDEFSFIKFLSSKFHDRVIYKKIGHISSRNRGEQGEDAVIDCVLLSRTNHLMKTNSNLSLCSLFFNPYLPYTNLSEGFWNPEKMLKTRLQQVFQDDFSRMNLLYTAFVKYLRNFEEVIFVLGSNHFSEKLVKVFIEIPQFIFQHSITESEDIFNKSKFPDPIDLVYITAEEHMLTFEEQAHQFYKKMKALCEKDLISRGGLIVIDNDAMDAFKEYALPYLLLNEFIYFSDEHLILQRKL